MDIKRIYPTKISFSDSDRQTILTRMDECLRTGQLAAGKYVEEFERRFADYTGTPHAVAVSSGGSALEAVVRALDVRGKEVLVPTNTFYATAAAVVAAGGLVRLIDIDPQTMSPRAEAIESVIGPKTVGVIIVHIGGVISPNMPDIERLCERQKLWLLEDCAHAHGSKLGGRAAGSFGIAGTYSFCATKVITSGEGGMVVTRDDQIARSVRLLRNYGKPEPWVTYCAQFGMNWRLTEIGAIIGLTQLDRLDEYIQWRTKVALAYSQALGSLEGFRAVSPTGRSSWYKYVILLPEYLDRETFRVHMDNSGVCLAGGVYDIPLHRQPIASGLIADGPFLGADYFCDRHVCLPLYFGMTSEDVDRVIAAVTRAWRGNE